MFGYIKEAEKVRLKKYRLSKLRALATSLGIDFSGCKKRDLICKIVDSLFVSSISGNEYTKEELCEKDEIVAIDYNSKAIEEVGLSSLDFSEWHKRAIDGKDFYSGFVCDLNQGCYCVENPYKSFNLDDCVKLSSETVKKYKLKVGDFVEIYKDTNEIFGINRRPVEIYKRISLEKLEVEQAKKHLDFGENPEKVPLQFSLLQGEKYLLCTKKEQMTELTKRFIDSLNFSQTEYSISLLTKNNESDYLDLFEDKGLLNIINTDFLLEDSKQEDFNRIMFLLYRIESILESSEDGIIIIEDIGSLLNMAESQECLTDYQKSIIFNIACKIKNGGSITVLVIADENDYSLIDKVQFLPAETIWLDEDCVPVSAPKNYKKKKQ